MKEWHLTSRKRKVRNGLVERILPCAKAPELLELYGTWIQKDGSQSNVKFLDWIKVEDRVKVRAKAWIRQIILIEEYIKKGDWFSRKYEYPLIITMVLNEKTDMWERLEL